MSGSHVFSDLVRGSLLGMLHKIRQFLEKLKHTHQFDFHASVLQNAHHIGISYATLTTTCDTDPSQVSEHSVGKKERKKEERKKKKL